METAQNLVIRNGLVIDRSQNISQVANVYIANGRIAGIGEPPDRGIQFESFDASGCVVTAGLVDCQVHAYEYVTPLGVNIDRTCLSKGVTTLVDAGSAGSSTFPGLRKFIAERSKAHLYCFLHIAQHGLASAGCVTTGSGGECDSLNVVNVQDCVRVINENRDMIVGIKVRLAAAVCDDGKNEEEVYRRALEAANICQVPLMTHHAMSTIGHGGKLGCPGSLRTGDIYTHCFHGYNSLLDPETGKVDSHCVDAKSRGVLFDVGHGQGSFSWIVAEQCATEGFWPDIISTDLHSDSINGPAYDLLCVMTKMLHLGMPLEDIVAAVTSTPATAIGLTGTSADITVLKVEEGSENLEDSCGDLRLITKMFVPVAVFIGGERCPTSAEKSWPNPSCAAECRARVAKNKETK
ncbi:unnamed protein product [Candidula unifasciata]|uniref:Dihydroorotase n=1 Tax=Candidula unifasciata TaxID=100452 RepID=A0A8S3Z8A3_9EUPU|nr:unnamed protein product [Candidula unifasciata]